MAESVLSALLTLNQRLIKAENLQELGFIIVNDTWQVLKFRQASVYLPTKTGRLKISSVTGLTPTKEATPFTLWLDRVQKYLLKNGSIVSPQPFTQQDLPNDLADGWGEWWPAFAYVVPVLEAKKCIGVVFLVREKAWSETDQQLINLLAEQWQHCIAAQVNRKKPSLFARLTSTKPILWVCLAALIASGFIPVRLTAMAEAEIISLNSEVVSSPAAGVIERFFVEPNNPVKVGVPLFELDQRELQNEIAVAKQTIEIAKADLHRAQQQSFNDSQSKAELASLRGKLREQELTLASLKDLSDRMVAKANRDGLFIYSDKNDWLGKPVVTGERVAELADETRLGVALWLPANDAINLEQGADVRIFLQIDPLNPIAATLSKTSYRVSQSPNGIAAYYLRGELQENQSPRIGLRGVAKVYGEERSLAYWMFRRPIGGLRQWLGL
ncbi:HlyD family efflux transporter periplasmic adaptor subunit [Marinobacterium sp. LSUCC0821]|uniref:HlyD family efflux transporter periplasmic adaptor subunit n=1 Tax=Marinobacterium sp. LSUCC0821 TaxID=2668067 RepID=UPI001452258A|nr:HlyD family efflux transporter periplasmic adaptor subunit [Marinobacterium sp. LSUCC0821]QJD71149.1 HlyD family efflux transporter periplasmic adaptor subunit [Marinobacterium sp. LSUCC0821]